ncbi:hypothetical protein COV20_01335 [Candidatus Woesearchaeota archaeon CG10_big_fil_rev_8_21_14_0_10_45_16]|nr:MAG: hypothetical protein COV20_01335 [Candidatus Woesearchaeota archaeon CG10_big_fil_rev_8_21_14_0_10_45_16]
MKFLDSFKLKTPFFISLAVDAVSFSLLALVFYLFAQYMQTKAILLSGGRTAEQIQQMLLTAPTEVVQSFSNDLKSLFYIMVVGGLLLIIASLFLYTFSRAYLWNTLLKKKFSKKNYWRWNGLYLLIMLISVLYAGLVFIVSFLLSSLIALIPEPNTVALLTKTLNSGFWMLFLIFIFITSYYFAKNYKVFRSLGEAFQSFNKRWPSLWRLFLWSLLILVALGFVNFGVTRYLIFRQTPLFVYNFIITILYLSWLRLYVFKSLSQ